MSTELTRFKTPEEEELEKKVAELTDLEVSLAQRELELVTLRSELHAFEARYLRTVGGRYAELDRIEAQIAQILADRDPLDTEKQQKATEAKAQAQESTETVGWAEMSKQTEVFAPSDGLKRLYREVAKKLHPDLATDPKDREKRQRFMAEANSAYELGNESRLREIIRQWETSPDSVVGDSPGAELVRTIRKIAQVKRRLRDIDYEIIQLGESELNDLKIRVENAERGGVDLLADMASGIEKQIGEARQRLTELSVWPN